MAKRANKIETLEDNERTTGSANGKLEWFEPNTEGFSGDVEKKWNAVLDAREEVKRATAEFETVFYGSLKKAVSAGKLNDVPSVSMGVNKGYGIRFGYRWGKLSIAFDPNEKYQPPGSGSSGGGNKRISF